MPRMASANEMLSKCSLSLTVAVSCEYCELKSSLLSVATPHAVSVSGQSCFPDIAGKNLGATTVMVPVWDVSRKTHLVPCVGPPPMPTPVTSQNLEQFQI